MTRLDTWLRRLFVAALVLGCVANGIALGESGEHNDALAMLLLGVIGAGVGWYMLGGDR